MEKRLVVFLILTFALIFVWTKIFPPPEKKPGPAKEGSPTAPAGRPEAEPSPQPAPEPAKPAVTEAPPEPEAGPVAVAPEEGEAVVLDPPGGVIRWTLDTWGGSVRQIELKDYAREPGQDLSDSASWYRLLSIHARDPVSRRPPRTLAFDLLDDRGNVRVSTSEVIWKVAEKSADRVVFTLDYPPAGVVFEKEYAFPKSAEGVEGPARHLELTIRCRVKDGKKAARYGENGLALRLNGLAGVAPEPITSLGPMLATEILTTNRVDPEDYTTRMDPAAPPKVFPPPEEQGPERRIDWVSSHSRFFTGILKSEDPVKLSASQVVMTPVSDISCEGKSQANSVPAVDFTIPFADPERRFLFYAGPLHPDYLKEGAYRTFAPLVAYGWLGIPKFLLFLLGGIQAVVSNWGVAIIVLTILVRLSMFPLSRKSQLAMQRYGKKMARVKPKMDAIKEKHANNKKKQQEEMMKLYREEGIRPPLGCLLMLLQMPVFFGLFIALRKSIDLRHQGFLWAKDLAGPDKAVPNLLVNHNVPLLADPFHLNILPILMGVFWYLSAAMAPKPEDPQQQSMQKMMKWMPVFFSLLLYNYAAGLAIYMVVSSLWSIFESKVVKKILFKEENSAPVGAPAATFRKGR